MIRLPATMTRCSRWALTADASTLGNVGGHLATMPGLSGQASNRTAE